MVDLKQRRDCYRVDDCRNIFDRLAVKNGVFLQVPVPSSSGDLLAIGSFAPGRFYRCLSPVAAVAFPQVPVPSCSGDMLAIGSFAPGCFYRCLSPVAAVVC